MKNKMYSSFVFCLLCVVIVFVFLYLGLFVISALNDATLIDKELDLTYIDDENPSRVRTSINSCNIATVTVEDFSKHIKGLFTGSIEGHDNIVVNVYLSEKELSKLDIGDVVIVRGNIKYYPSNSKYYDHYIVIGDAISIFPISFDAKLVEIVQQE